jgi:hypothetical protein
MITAKEANEIWKSKQPEKESLLNKEIENILDLVYKGVKEESEKGENVIYVQERYYVSKEWPFVIKKLEELGYQIGDSDVSSNGQTNKAVNSIIRW